MNRAPESARRAEIPIVDLISLETGREEHFRNIGDSVRAAAADVGFFYVKNHGVPDTVIERAASIGRSFFNHPPELKRQVAVNSRHRGFVPVGGANVAQGRTFDLKETFSWGLELPEDDPDVAAGNPLMGPNNWPSFLPELRPALYDYFEASFVCGQRLLRAIAVSLGIDPAFFSVRYRKPFARGQVVHYPPQPPEMGAEQFGIGQHTDFGCVTLLWQDGNGGLQVLNRRNEWIAATPIDGTLVINIGDLLERWSNDRFKSTLHRVVNSSGRDRISLTVFYDPDYSTTVDPRDMGLGAGETARYEPVGAGDHIRARFDKTFVYRHREKAEAR